MPDHTKKERAKKSTGRKSNPISRFFQSTFGMGVEGRTGSLSKAEGVFGRATQRMDKNIEALRRKR